MSAQLKYAELASKELSFPDTGKIPREARQGLDTRQEEDIDGEIQQLHGELARLARLNELGEMAYTLAHELAQPLAVIANYAQGSARMLKTDPDTAIGQVQDVLSEITQQALRASDIIRHLRQLISKGCGERKPSRMRDIIRDAMKIALLGVPPTAVRTEIAFEAECDIVFADRIQIEQVVINLVRNALEAMDTTVGAKLTVKVRNEPDDAIIVEVHDTGTGIAPEMESGLFQPFSSNKPKGLGIGLAISKRIIEAHGGRISGRRGPRCGAIFSFSLPLSGGPDIGE